MNDQEPNGWAAFLRNLHRDPRTYAGALLAGVVAANTYLHWIPDAWILAITAFGAAVGFSNRSHAPKARAGDESDDPDNPDVLPLQRPPA